MVTTLTFDHPYRSTTLPQKTNDSLPIKPENKKIVAIIITISIALGAILLAMSITFVCLHSTAVGIPLMAIGGICLLIGLLTFMIQQMKYANSYSEGPAVNEDEAIRYVRALTDPDLENKKAYLHKLQEELKKIQDRKTAIDTEFETLETQKLLLIASVNTKQKELDKGTIDKQFLKNDLSDKIMYDPKEKRSKKKEHRHIKLQIKHLTKEKENIEKELASITEKQEPLKAKIKDFEAKIDHLSDQVNECESIIVNLEFLHRSKLKLSHQHLHTSDPHGLHKIPTAADIASIKKQTNVLKRRVDALSS